MPTERRPNLFIVGAQKSGTSALSGWLDQHPEIFMSFPKEPGYLAFGEQGYVFPDGYGKPAPAREYVVTSESDYLRLFAGAAAEQTVLGEASTWYFSVPGMAQRIKDYNPQARVLVMLRNPVERAYSAWGHARRDNLEPCERFADALDMEEQRGEVEFLLRYHRMGMYSAAVKEFLQVFGPQQFKVLFYEDLQLDPQGLWRGTCDFLGVNSSGPVPGQDRYNRSGNPRSRLLQNLLRSHRFKSFFRSLLPHRLLTWVKARVDDVNLKALPPLDETSAHRLQDYYREDVQALAQCTGRDLSAWLR